MGIMKILDELEQELYNKGVLILDKKEWYTDVAKS